MNLHNNPIRGYSSRQTGLTDNPAPEYLDEYRVEPWVPLPVTPQVGDVPITEDGRIKLEEEDEKVLQQMRENLNKIHEKYQFGSEQANRNAYAESQYDHPNYHRSLESIFAYQFPSEDPLEEYKTIFQGVEYYTSMNPIDRAYQISRKTNCMGGAPRLPGLLSCPYGTDAIACAYHAA